MHRGSMRMAPLETHLISGRATARAAPFARGRVEDERETSSLTGARRLRDNALDDRCDIVCAHPRRVTVCLRFRVTAVSRTPEWTALHNFNTRVRPSLFLCVRRYDTRAPLRTGGSNVGRTVRRPPSVGDSADFREIRGRPVTHAAPSPPSPTQPARDVTHGGHLSHALVILTTDYV
ncbi:hypothetical protein EVAR_21485_1 [Eumeta japonica]|uniref:Uncharacterized protein n=1 Tax=Eumeta variegata TaxID=151549 RepID=A0A4C1UXM1_EUMVA|nr:hypothetical protein EVAR_21485_1 [Eumeta japonica]